MRPYILLGLIVSLVHVLAEEKPVAPATAEMPRDVEIQEQYVLLSAKVKNLAEVQDVLLKQQQLLFENLQALRQQIDKLDLDRTNLLARADLTGFLAKLDDLQQQFETSRETNLQAVLKAMQELPPRANPGKVALATNLVPVAVRLEQYRVQPGDTLSKIAIRWNDALERRGLPRISQDQIERANPAIAPDRIRSGQILLMPVPELKPETLR